MGTVILWIIGTYLMVFVCVVSLHQLTDKVNDIHDTCFVNSEKSGGE